LYFGVALRGDDDDGTLANCTMLTALFVDIDFSTTPEPEARERLTHCPLSPSALVASGGGLHAYYLLREPLPLPGDAGLARGLLRRLAGYLGGDLASAEPARVLRIPGGLNHKYQPARPVTIEHLDATVRYTVSDFGDWLPSEPAETPTTAGPVDGAIVEGARNVTLTSLAGTMRKRGMAPVAIEAALLAENAARCRPPLPADEVRTIAHSIGSKAPGETPAHGAATRRWVTLTAASTIRVRPVRWLWDGRLALTTLGLLGGREGVGKSTIAYTLAADATRGRLPGAYTGTPRGVIVAATEDSWEHTIVPRLMAADADLTRVYRVDVTTIEGTEGSLSLPSDLPEVERLAREVDAVLILLDPLLSRLDAALDTHKDAEVRLALEPLVRTAGATGACVLGLIHVNKGTSGDPLTMLMGSRAFAAVARSVLFVMVDPEDEQKRLLGTPKNNLGRCDLPTLAFRIVGANVADTPEGPVWTQQVIWLGETHQTIKEAIAAATVQAGDRTATQEAADWLHDYLESQGGTADSATLKEAGRKAGHTRDCLLRARDRVHVITDSQGFPRRTSWSLQSSQASAVQSSHQSSHSPGETCCTATTASTDANQGVQSTQSTQSSQSSDTPRARATTGRMLRFGIDP
jgi:hypothetical protein